jgi:RNA polymerase sigma-70 factor, ECF subfamily
MLGFLSRRARGDDRGRLPAAPGDPPAASPAAAVVLDGWSIWHRARLGEEAAARQLVAHLTPQAYALAVRLVGRREDAEDAVQDAFVRLWRSQPRDDVGATLGTFFNTIVINRCRSALVARREWATDPDDLGDLPDADVAGERGNDASASDPGWRLDRIQDRQALDRALKGLPVRQRMALAMWAFADQSVPEIAALMELDANAAHQLLNRARRSLRAHLEAGAS